MGADLKKLLAEFGEGVRAEQASDLLNAARELQRSVPGMSFDEAWNRSKAAHDSLLPVEEVPRE